MKSWTIPPFVGDVKEWNPATYLESLHTRQLMKLRELGQAYEWGCIINDKHHLTVTLTEINSELNTREHIPNKEEAKKIRQLKAKRK